MVEPNSNPKAYVQCDWVACQAAGDRMIPEYASRYSWALSSLNFMGVVNCATWAFDSKSDAFHSPEEQRSWHAKRNTQEIDKCDLVISMFYRDDPPRCHWGSISLMAYAIAKGKPCFVISEDDCVVWKHHMLYHPLVKRLDNLQDLKPYIERWRREGTCLEK